LRVNLDLGEVELVTSFRAVLLRNIVRLYARKLGGVHSLAERALVSPAELNRLLEFASRPDRETERRLLAFFRHGDPAPPGGWPEPRMTASHARHPAVEYAMH
jgi:hypothetical protein